MNTIVRRVAWTVGLAMLTAPIAAGQSPGVSAADLVERALQANREITAVRLDLERGRARLRQAGLRPNPTIDVEQTTGRFTGEPGEHDLTVGLALPIELGGKRQRRIDLAEAQLAATEMEVADQERRLAREVLTAYAEALAAQRELHVTNEAHELDTQTTRVVQARVDVADAPRLELNLLLTEVDRLRSRQALLEGRLQSTLIALKQRIGAPPDDPFIVSDASMESIRDPFPTPTTLEQAISMALERRPDLQLARLNEAAAEAGLRLARAAAFPEITVSGKFTAGRQVTDLPPPLPAFPDADRLLAFGVSIGLPVFNKNQGARAEAAVEIRQARLRRESTEQTVRADVSSAFRRAEAARAAVAIFEQGILARSTDNVRVMRAAYELGQFRITDLITEQRRLLDAQREYTDALIERYRGLIDLNAAIGVPFRRQP